MGTSSSNYGPSKNTPLLPDWNENDSGKNQDDNANSESTQNNDNGDAPFSGNWSGARRSLGNFSTNPSRTNFNRAARSYVKASGGAKNVAKSAHYGKVSAGKVVAFLNGIRQSGIGGTSDNLGIGNIQEQSIEQIFNKLADSLSSSGGTDEETIARNAVVEALGKIYEDFDLENNSLDSLNQITEEQSSQYLEYYISAYIYERWLHELGVKMEQKDISSSEIINAERIAYDFIQSSVNLNIDEYNISTFDYNSTVGKGIIDDVFVQAYTIIEEL